MGGAGVSPCSRLARGGDSLWAGHQQRAQTFTHSQGQNQSLQTGECACFWTVGRNWAAWRKPTQALGEHANSTHTCANLCTTMQLQELLDSPAKIPCKHATQKKNYFWNSDWVPVSKGSEADFRPEEQRFLKAATVGKAEEQLPDRAVGRNQLHRRCAFHFLHILLIHRASFHPAPIF